MLFRMRKSEFRINEEAMRNFEFYGNLFTSGKTFTLLSDDGVTTRVVQHCFERIDNDEIHNYKVRRKRRFCFIEKNTGASFYCSNS